MAEWSKALVLGTSPKGRGFESHSCQKYFTDHTQIFKSVVAPGEARTHNPGMPQCTVYKYRALTDCATGAYWQKGPMQGVGFEPTQSYDYESLNLTP